MTYIEYKWLSNRFIPVLLLKATTVMFSSVKHNNQQISKKEMITFILGGGEKRKHDEIKAKNEQYSKVKSH